MYVVRIDHQCVRSFGLNGLFFSILLSIPFSAVAFHFFDPQLEVIVLVGLDLSRHVVPLAGYAPVERNGPGTGKGKGRAMDAPGPECDLHRRDPILGTDFRVFPRQ